jgi:hypothetical protein
VKVRLTHVDGKLPNLALMKLAHWHRTRGDEVFFSRSLTREMFEPEYGRVYGSAIFKFSRDRISTLVGQFPDAILGGTGSDAPVDATVEQLIGVGEYEHYDYSLYPDFEASIGFTARGCRLNCGFCGVRKKEGKPRSVNTVPQVWRGEPFPRHLHLLDNDFFGEPRWRARVAEILDGGFKVCFSQGINIRLVTEEAAEYLALIPYYDDQFRKRRLYTAWDNLKDEEIFFRGVDTLERHGVPPTHLMVYMLIGFDPTETMERILYRFHRMASRGIRPYPMVYNNANPTLKRFQRWAIRASKMGVPWEEYDANAKGWHVADEQAGTLFDEVSA